jgi:hypothetical protein
MICIDVEAGAPPDSVVKVCNGDSGGPLNMQTGFNDANNGKYLQVMWKKMLRCDKSTYSCYNGKWKKSESGGIMMPKAGEWQHIRVPILPLIMDSN